LLNAISDKKYYYYLPASFTITGHTDFSGNIYISNEFKRVIENEIEIEKNDKSFLCLATLCHEIMGHFFKLLFGNKKYMNTPRYCMLYNDKKQELYPDAGCFMEIMLFGSVINSVSQIEGKSQLLFEKIIKKQKITENYLNELKIPISHNKEDCLHPVEYKHEFCGINK